MGPPQNRRFCGERRRSGTSEFCRLRRNERCVTCVDDDRPRPVCLRPKCRRKAAVGLQHRPAGLVFSARRKENGGWNRPIAPGRKTSPSHGRRLARRRLLVQLEHGHRSVKQTGRRPVCSVGRSGYAARREPSWPRLLVQLEHGHERLCGQLHAPQIAHPLLARPAKQALRGPLWI